MMSFQVAESQKMSQMVTSPTRSYQTENVIIIIISLLVNGNDYHHYY